MKLKDIEAGYLFQIEDNSSYASWARGSTFLCLRDWANRKYIAQIKSNPNHYNSIYSKDIFTIFYYPGNGGNENQTGNFWVYGQDDYEVTLLSDLKETLN